MRKYLNIFLLFILLFGYSCSAIRLKIKESMQQLPVQHQSTKKEKSLKCSTKSPNLILASENENNSKIALDYFQHTNLTFIEQVVSFTLLHAYTRPDIVGPHAKVQAIVKTRKSTQYYDYIPKEQNIESFTLFHALENLLEKYPSKKSLSTLIRLLQKESIKKIVDESFNTFLEKNIKDIQRSTRLSEHYTRGQQVLQAGESMPTLNLFKSYKRFQQNKASYKHTNSAHLFPAISLNKSSNNTTLCSFDFELYQKGIYVIQPQPTTNSLSFSLLNKKGEMAFININQKLQHPITADINHGYFKVTKKAVPASFCLIKAGESQTILLSNKGRDPSQLLHHILLEQKAPSTQTEKEIEQYILKGRNIKLFLPERIIVESSRYSDEEIHHFNKLNLPIYHSPRLGLIWASHQGPENINIYTDPRWPGQVQCSPSQ